MLLHGQLLTTTTGCIHEVIAVVSKSFTELYLFGFIASLKTVVSSIVNLGEPKLPSQLKLLRRF